MNLSQMMDLRDFVHAPPLMIIFVKRNRTPKRDGHKFLKLIFIIPFISTLLINFLDIRSIVTIRVFDLTAKYNDIYNKLSYKINFTQYTEGVHDLEIYWGVSVKHNFSAIRSLHYATLLNNTILIVRYDSGFMKENFMFLPPYEFKPPRGLSHESYGHFWKQRDHYISFYDIKDWHVTVSWDITNGTSRLSHNGCNKHNRTHHVNFCEWPTQTNDTQINGAAVAVGSHWIYMFQHTFDNGWPHIAAAVLSTGLDIKKIHLATESCGDIVDQIEARVGFANKTNCLKEANTISAKRLILLPALRVVHPFYFDHWTQSIHLPNPTRNKVILLPRGLNKYGGKGERIIHNLLELVGPLSKLFGEDSIVVFDCNEYKNLTKLIDLFSAAKYIIGPHGGAFYNQFFAGTNVYVIEMIPIKHDGHYPNLDMGQMCIYSNTQMLRQKLYRYYTYTNQPNYNIDIKDFMNWFDQVMNDSFTPDPADLVPPNGTIISNLYAR